MKRLWTRLAELVKKRVQDSIIAKIAIVLSLVIVFCTTYLLVLPALTISTNNSSEAIQSTESSVVSSVSTESTLENTQKSSSQTETSTSQEVDESQEESSDTVAAGTLSAETSDVVVTATYDE